jgi:hypothetical protein
MLSRITAVVSLVVLCAATPPPAKPKTVAPDTFPHAVAMFLSGLSSDGKQRVAFKASAIGTHFFFEEPTGVSVYVFDGVGYRRQSFLKGNTLGQALAKFKVPPKPKPAAAKSKK